MIIEKDNNWKVFLLQGHIILAGEVVFSPYAKDGSKHLDLELDIELEKFRKRRNLVRSQWE